MVMILTMPGHRQLRDRWRHELRARAGVRLLFLNSAARTAGDQRLLEAEAGEQQQGAGGGLASGLVNNVANIALRKTDLWNFALFHEGNLHNNLFFKVRDRSIDIQC